MPHAALGKDLIVELLFAALLLRGACPACPTSTPDSFPYEDSFPYGVVYPSLYGEWVEAERLALRSELEYLHSQGVNTVIQDFSISLLGTGREQDWLIFLDEAQRAGIGVVVYPYGAERWDGQQFDTAQMRGFLAVVGNYVAVVGVLGLHEPLEQYTITQLQGYYAQVKAYAPRLPIAHLIGNMAWFVDEPRFPDRALAPGVCDICL